MSQPEALELADLFDRGGTINALHKAAAIELRRLHEENIALRQAIEHPEKQECEICAAKRKRLLDAGFLKSPLRGEDHVD
jgi:hypothetical protein